MNDNLDVLKKTAVSLFLRAVLSPFKLVPIKKKRVLFTSFRGGQYSCNPRAISEALQKLHGNELEIAWAFREPEKFRCLEEKGIRVLDDRSFEFIRYALTARVVCTNMLYKPYLPRRKGQCIMQTWHGGGAYKRVGRSEKISRLKHRYQDMQFQGGTVYLSSSCAFTMNTIRESFNHKGEVMEYGMPRNDVLLNGDHEVIRTEVKAELGLSPNEKLALYAPTYRDGNSRDAYDMDYRRVLGALSARFGGTWRLAFRTHNFLKLKDASVIGEDVVNACAYPDMQRLLIASDVLITDYSSSIWDMSLMFKPAFLYANDLKDYVDKRDFYTDIHTWPFPLAENNDEMEKIIREFDPDEYSRAVKRHHEELGSVETGRASEEAAKRIWAECTKEG